MEWKRWFFVSESEQEESAALEDELDRESADCGCCSWADPKTSRDGKRTWRSCLRFIGPGYMVAVGYMDPGNW